MVPALFLLAAYGQMQMHKCLAVLFTQIQVVQIPSRHDEPSHAKAM